MNIFDRSRVIGISILLVVVLTAACSKSGSGPEEKPSISLSGTTALEGHSDHSGINVLLFKADIVDSSLISIIQAYPSLGVQNVENYLFDYRRVSPTYSTQTQTDGSWKVENVQQGNYHIVVQKEGFGWRYKLNETINSSKQVTGLEKLLPVVVASGNINTNIDLAPYQQLHIISNAIILPGVSITVREGGALLLGNSVTLENRGLLSISGNNSAPAQVSSLDIFNQWNTIQVENEGSIVLTDAVVSNSNSGIRVENDVNSEIHHCLFSYNNRGLKISNFSQIHLNNLIGFRNSETVSFSVVGLVTISNSIFQSNTNSILGGSVVAEIRNNYFSTNSLSIDISESDLMLENCHFEKNILALKTNAGNNYQITANNFENNTADIVTNFLLTAGPGTYIVHNNNFIDTENIIFQQDQGSVRDSVQAENNWWGTLDMSAIDEKIVDCRDNDLLKCVSVTPILVLPNDSAGIIQ